MKNNVIASNLEVLVVQGQKLNISEQNLVSLINEFGVSVPFVSESLIVVEDFSARLRKILELNQEYYFSVVEIHGLYEIRDHFNGSDSDLSLIGLAKFVRYFFDRNDELNVDYTCDVLSRLKEIELSIEDTIRFSEEQNEGDIEILMEYLENNRENL